MTMAILPEWNSLPDMVLYSWPGARRWSSETSWMPSMKVELLRRYRGVLAAMGSGLSRAVSIGVLRDGVLWQGMVVGDNGEEDLIGSPRRTEDNLQ